MGEVHHKIVYTCIETLIVTTLVAVVNTLPIGMELLGSAIGVVLMSLHKIGTQLRVVQPHQLTGMGIFLDVEVNKIVFAFEKRLPRKKFSRSLLRSRFGE